MPPQPLRNPSTAGYSPVLVKVKVASHALASSCFIRRQGRAKDYSRLHKQQPAASPPKGTHARARRRGALVIRVSAASATNVVATVAQNAGAMGNYFTPETCLLGGITMGVVTAGKLLLTGRVLGISGALKGLVQDFDLSPWRFSFLGGLAAGGLFMAGSMPGLVETLPASFPVTRAVIGAAMVGAGASLGNGCTSGHGISGNARLSLRSMAYTCVFMAAGIVTAYLTGTTAAMGIPNVPAAYVPITPAELAAGLTALAITGSSLLAALLTVFVYKSVVGPDESMQSPQLLGAVSNAVEFVAGGAFGMALMTSGMVRPTKVAAFLNMVDASRNFSLIFVMGGALLVATPLVNLILRKYQKPSTSTCFQVPTNKVIDKELLVGGVLFGAGWGYAGACPGPMLVNLVVNPTTLNIATVVALVFGMYLAKYIKPMLASPKAVKAS